MITFIDVAFSKSTNINPFSTEADHITVCVSFRVKGETIGSLIKEIISGYSFDSPFSERFFLPIQKYDSIVN